MVGWIIVALGKSMPKTVGEKTGLIVLPESACTVTCKENDGSGTSCTLKYAQKTICVEDAAKMVTQKASLAASDRFSLGFLLLICLLPSVVVVN